MSALTRRLRSAHQRLLGRAGRVEAAPLEEPACEPAAESGPDRTGAAPISILDAVHRSEWGWSQTLQVALLFLVLGGLIIGVVVAVGQLASASAGIAQVIGPVVGLVAVLFGGYTTYRAGR